MNDHDGPRGDGPEGTDSHDDVPHDDVPGSTPADGIGPHDDAPGSSGPGEQSTGGGAIDPAVEQELRAAFHAAADGIQPEGRPLPAAPRTGDTPRPAGWFGRHRAVVAAVVAVLAIAGGIGGTSALLGDDGVQTAGPASQGNGVGGQGTDTGGQVANPGDQGAGHGGDGAGGEVTDPGGGIPGPIDRPSGSADPGGGGSLPPPPLNPDGMGASGSASCAAPFLNTAGDTVVPDRDPPYVRPGETITIYGHYYGSTCDDIGACAIDADGSQDCDPADAPQPEPEPVAVTLTVTLPGGEPTPLDPVTPSIEGGPSFAVPIHVPAGTPTGPAIISDGLVASFTFMVTRADGPGLGPTGAPTDTVPPGAVSEPQSGGAVSGPQPGTSPGAVSGPAPDSAVSGPQPGTAPDAVSGPQPDTSPGSPTG